MYTIFVYSIFIQIIEIHATVVVSVCFPDLSSSFDFQEIFFQSCPSPFSGKNSCMLNSKNKMSPLWVNLVSSA